MKEYYMRMAIELARKGAGKVSPNPMVGCVIARNNRIISKAYHQYCGGLHAEALALKRAKGKAKGATMYVNLEPCCHTGKRTPPCIPGIVKSGVKEVAVGMIDPNPRVNCRGIKALENNKIKCTLGVLKKESEELNKYYIKWITKQMPYVMLKWAMSLDGKTAAKTGDSKWISSDTSRGYVHKMRSEVDAVLVGINTVLKDNPQLTAHGAGRNPVRIVVDPNLKIPLNSRVLSQEAGTIIFYIKSRVVNENKIKVLNNIKTVKLFGFEYSKEIDFNEVMKILGCEKITSVMIEGGGNTNAFALKYKIVDEIMAFISPKIIGGKQAITPVEGIGINRISDSIKINDINIRHFKDDILILGKIKS